MQKEYFYLLKVPENNTGSCGMIAILDRSLFNEIVDVSMPSIMILPSTHANRKIAPIRELLPRICEKCIQMVIASR